MTSDLGDRLRTRWETALAGLPGRFSLNLRSLTAEVAGREARSRHYAASTIKVAVLAAWLDARASGVRAANGTALVHARFPSRTGGRFELSHSDDQDDATWARLGTDVDLAQLAEPMITLSSNIATDLIAERIGITAVADFLARIGLDGELSLQRLIGDSSAEDAGFTNTVTAAGLTALVAGLANGSWLTGPDSALAIDLLARQTHLDGIPAGLPSGTWSASKGGWVPGVRHDVALVRPTSAPPYLLAVCTTSTLPDSEALQVIRRLSAITWEEWTAAHS